MGCIGDVSKNKMNLNITIGSTTVTALFHTGSPYTVMSRSTYRSIPHLGKWINQKLPIRGLSETNCYTLGYKWVTIVVNEESYDLQCHIVEDRLLPMRMLLGRDLLEQVHITIIAGNPTIKKLETILPENDIMVIQPTEHKADVTDLDCIQEISDLTMRNEVADMVRNYQPKKGLKSCVQMEILVSDAMPVYQNPRRLSAMERDVANTMVERFLRDGIVLPSKSPYASPILLRKKKNGTYRFCVDYRKINQKIIKDSYPLPLMEDVIEDLQDDLVFSSLDLTDGLYHVDVEENSVKYTSFITPDGQWEFIKAPQGLCNSPANFQRYINTVFHDAKTNKLLKLYLDDVLISSHDEESQFVQITTSTGDSSGSGAKNKFQQM